MSGRIIRYTVQAPAGTPVPTEVIQSELAVIRREAEGAGFIEMDLQAIGLGKPFTERWEATGWRVIECPERPWKVSTQLLAGCTVIPFPKAPKA